MCDHRPSPEPAVPPLIGRSARARRHAGSRLSGCAAQPASRAPWGPACPVKVPTGGILPVHCFSEICRRRSAEAESPSPHQSRTQWANVSVHVPPVRSRRHSSSSRRSGDRDGNLSVTGRLARRSSSSRGDRGRLEDDMSTRSGCRLQSTGTTSQVLSEATV